MYEVVESRPFSTYKQRVTRKHDDLESALADFEDVVRGYGLDRDATALYADSGDNLDRGGSTPVLIVTILGQ